METKKFNNYDELLAEAKKVGIRDTKLDLAIEAHSLPEQGQFSDSVELIENGTLSHIRIICTDGSVMGIGRLTSAPALVASKDLIPTTQQMRDTKKASYKKYFISGQRVNPHLPADQAKCAIKLMGKKFKAEKVDGFVLPYLADANAQPDFCNTAEELKARAVRRTFYKVTLID